MTSARSKADNARRSAAARSFLRMLQPLDVITVIFTSAMMLLIIAFRHRQEDWLWQCAFYQLVAVWVLLLAVLHRFRPSPTLAFIRLWYPLLVCILFFENVGNLIHLVRDGWQDPLLLQVDRLLLGADPTVWMQQFARPWLNDLMQGTYTSYFFLNALLGVWLIRAGRRDRAAESLFGTALTYYGCYLFFLLFPVEGPHHTLFYQHTVDLQGGWPTALINWIEGFARVHGGAFPSAHVAGATVVLLYAFRYARRLFWMLLPPVLGLYAATVYGRYHYFADVWAGWLTAGLGFWAARALYGRLGRLLQQPERGRESGPVDRRRKCLPWEEGRRDCVPLG